jgi:DNA-binding MarR family transcriptional regulator
MAPVDDAPSDNATIALIYEVFRLNGRLLAAADRLVSQFGLTSARWQVLGAIAIAPTPQPVARLARDMGLARQGVQRIVNELAQEGVVVLQDNPHHRRARLVLMSDRGRQAFDAAVGSVTLWADALADGIETGSLVSAGKVIETLRKRLEAQSEVTGDDD